MQSLPEGVPDKHINRIVYFLIVFRASYIVQNGKMKDNEYASLEIHRKEEREW